MIGLVIAAHGPLGEALLASARQIMGDLPQVATCAVAPGASISTIQDHLREEILRVDAGQGVLVLTDLLGGSPCTQSLSLCRDATIEVLTGVNLPMVLKAATLRAVATPPTLADLAHDLVAYGQRTIICATDRLRRVARGEPESAG